MTNKNLFSQIASESKNGMPCTVAKSYVVLVPNHFYHEASNVSIFSSCSPLKVCGIRHKQKGLREAPKWVDNNVQSAYKTLLCNYSTVYCPGRAVNHSSAVVPRQWEEWKTFNTLEYFPTGCSQYVVSYHDRSRWCTVRKEVSFLEHYSIKMKYFVFNTSSMTIIFYSEQRELSGNMRTYTHTFIQIQARINTYTYTRQLKNIGFFWLFNESFVQKSMTPCFLSH